MEEDICSKGNEDILQALDGIVDDHFEQVGRTRKRSSILKQPKIPDEMCLNDDINRRKSTSSKRVSFADKFQVMELCTGNIYDVLGKSGSSDSTSYDHLNSNAKSEITTVEENSNVSEAQVEISSSLKDFQMKYNKISVSKKHKIVSDDDCEPVTKKWNKLDMFYLENKSSFDVISEFKKEICEISHDDLKEEHNQNMDLTLLEKVKINSHPMQNKNLNMISNAILTDVSEGNDSYSKKNETFLETLAISKDTVTETNSFSKYDKPNMKFYANSTLFIPSENKENYFIDEKNKNILKINTMCSKLKIKTALQNPQNINLLNDIHHVADMKGYPDVPIYESKEKYIFDKTCLLNQSMELTCAFDFEKTDDCDIIDHNNSSTSSKANILDRGITDISLLENQNSNNITASEFKHSCANLDKTRLCFDNMDLTCLDNEALENSPSNTPLRKFHSEFESMPSSVNIETIPNSDIYQNFHKGTMTSPNEPMNNVTKIDTIITDVNKLSRKEYFLESECSANIMLVSCNSTAKNSDSKYATDVKHSFSKDILNDNIEGNNISLLSKSNCDLEKNDTHNYEISPFNFETRDKINESNSNEIYIENNQNSSKSDRNIHENALLSNNLRIIQNKNLCINKSSGFEELTKNCSLFNEGNSFCLSEDTSSSIMKLTHDFENYDADSNIKKNDVILENNESIQNYMLRQETNQQNILLHNKKTNNDLDYRTPMSRSQYMDLTCNAQNTTRNYADSLKSTISQIETQHFTFDEMDFTCQDTNSFLELEVSSVGEEIKIPEFTKKTIIQTESDISYGKGDGTNSVPQSYVSQEKEFTNDFVGNKCNTSSVKFVCGKSIQNRVSSSKTSVNTQLQNETDVSNYTLKGDNSIAYNMKKDDAVKLCNFVFSQNNAEADNCLSDSTMQQSFNVKENGKQFSVKRKMLLDENLSNILSNEDHRISKLSSMSPVNDNFGDKKTDLTSDMMELTCKTQLTDAINKEVSLVHSSNQTKYFSKCGMELTCDDLNKNESIDAAPNVPITHSANLKILDENGIKEVDMQFKSNNSMYDTSSKSINENLFMGNNQANMDSSAVSQSNGLLHSLLNNDAKISCIMGSSSDLGDCNTSYNQILSKDNYKGNAFSSVKISDENCEKGTEQNLLKSNLCNQLVSKVNKNNLESNNKMINSDNPGVIYAIKKLKSMSSLTHDFQYGNLNFPEISFYLTKQLKPLTSFSCTKIKLSNAEQNSLRQSCSFIYNEMNMKHLSDEHNKLMNKDKILCNPMVNSENFPKCSESIEHFSSSNNAFISQKKFHLHNSLEGSMLQLESDSILNNVSFKKYDTTNSISNANSNLCVYSTPLKFNFEVNAVEINLPKILQKGSRLSEKELCDEVFIEDITKSEIILNKPSDNASTDNKECSFIDNATNIKENDKNKFFKTQILSTDNQNPSTSECDKIAENEIPVPFQDIVKSNSNVTPAFEDLNLPSSVKDATCNQNTIITKPISYQNMSTSEAFNCPLEIKCSETSQSITNVSLTKISSASFPMNELSYTMNSTCANNSLNFDEYSNNCVNRKDDQQFQETVLYSTKNVNNSSSSFCTVKCSVDVISSSNDVVSEENYITNQVTDIKPHIRPTNGSENIFSTIDREPVMLLETNEIAKSKAECVKNKTYIQNDECDNQSSINKKAVQENSLSILKGNENSDNQLAFENKTCTSILDNIYPVSGYEKFYDLERIIALRKKFMEASEHHSCQWKLKEIDEEEAIFELMGTSFFAAYLMHVPLQFTSEIAFDKEISFQHLKPDPDDIDDLGLLFFLSHLSDDDKKCLPFCADTLLNKFPTFLNTALKAKAFVKDLWFASFKNAHSIDISLNRFKVTIINENLFSEFALIFNINFKTYPEEKIIPEIEHIDYDRIDEKIIHDCLEKIEPGKDYLTKMVNAVYEL